MDMVLSLGLTSTAPLVTTMPTLSDSLRATLAELSQTPARSTLRYHSDSSSSSESPPTEPASWLTDRVGSSAACLRTHMLRNSRGTYGVRGLRSGSPHPVRTSSSGMLTPIPGIGFEGTGSSTTSFCGARTSTEIWASPPEFELSQFWRTFLQWSTRRSSRT